MSNVKLDRYWIILIIQTFCQYTLLIFFKELERVWVFVSFLLKDEIGLKVKNIREILMNEKVDWI